MLYSMTGFGKSEATANDIQIQAEIRSLNSKGLDVNVRLPQIVKSKELQIRNLITQELKRGKVDLFMSLDLPDNQQAAKINKEIFNVYFSQIEELNLQLQTGSKNLIDTILRLPNVLVHEDEEINEQTWASIQSALKDACSRLISFRKLEGEKMEIVLRSSIKSIGEELKEIPQYEDERTEKVRERMINGLKSIQEQVDIDQNRIEQELVYYIEKFDITEEKVRLAAHLEHFLSLLDSKETITKGKKLSFISQEIGREINTIGSKANHLAIQKHVVNMKDQLEQIKEQLSNIL